METNGPQIWSPGLIRSPELSVEPDPIQGLPVFPGCPGGPKTERNIRGRIYLIRRRRRWQPHVDAMMSDIATSFLLILCKPLVCYSLEMGIDTL